jgi:hypothetical protein
MADETDPNAGVALDGFVDYYTEKLWNWIPGHYRTEDAHTPTPGTLRRLIEQMGTDAATLRRRIDRLWENNFVELADDDALVQLGELLATRMVHALNRRGRRVDVARTIFYRRRKGTPRVLESLLTDITGWTGVQLETWRLLGRTHHLLEPAPTRTTIFSDTPRGGWADLRSQRLPSLAYTGFEELAHTPDFRRYDRGVRGRYGIPKVGAHLYRMRAFKVIYPTLAPLGDNHFTFDPSGRAVPLFQPADRPTADQWEQLREWQMPKALSCRLFNHSEYEWTDAIIDAISPPLAEAALLKKYSGWRIPSTLELRRFLTALEIIALPDIVNIMNASLVTECGRAKLYTSDLDAGQAALTLAVGEDNDIESALSSSEVICADLTPGGEIEIALPLIETMGVIADPRLGLALTPSVNPILAPVLHYGAPGEIGAGTYDRRFDIVTEDVHVLSDGGDDIGPIPMTIPSLLAPVDQVADSKTYNPGSDLGGLEDYRLQAENFQRPYLLRSIAAAPLLWKFTAALKDPPTELRHLVLEGLWLGIEDADQAEVPNPTLPVEAILAFEGVWDRIEIRHCTIDPGGEKIRMNPPAGTPIPYVKLEIRGHVEELIIESSITGPIAEVDVGGDPSSVGKLIIRDSIIRGIPGTVDAISTLLAAVEIERSTVIGNIVVNRLHASDSLFTGTGEVTDLQHSCFRFSAALEGKWPHPFESHFYTDFSPLWLVSTTFGDPGFGLLSEAAPAEILRGAENHAAMGVYNHLFDAIKRDDLRAKFSEFLPFDVIPQIDIEN